MPRITEKDIRGVCIALTREIDRSPALADWTIEVEKGSKLYDYSWTATLIRDCDKFEITYRGVTAKGLHDKLSAVVSTLYQLNSISRGV